ncbi:acyloxyacyl hydrolase [Seonamhaeicola marinus]|uniref:Acyloxyacyl hydrolase n=1 Tax=Seonamhaeicola marinus TaxID=1912246 RepID=A0A5D0HF22_9FLAO|nr:acyloxyacyl hydrolase [Seonamhaeicola marinus]TYA69871.1 acyloxyacyl hydrolase [Seonamhaeicola marinus]
MRYLVTCFLCVYCCFAFSQEKQYTSYFDVNYFKGNIAKHNDDILHLISGHPEGIILSWNKKTYGFKDWEQRYNYPDYGVSFAYQDLKNETLGKNFSAYAHYNFYFFKRHLIFRVGQGLAYTTNPFNKETNFKNVAFGSKFMSSTYIMLNYKKERIFDKFGLQAGFSLLHYSNANFKAPNNGTNSITFNLGVTYNLDDIEPEYQYTVSKEDDQDYSEPIKYNLVFRTGLNESDIIGSGSYPLFVFSGYADKRINRKSALQLGADVFFSTFLKEYVKYRAAAFPEGDISGDEDYKRVGLFAGHELFVNRTSLLTQLGYYVVYPFEFEGRTYVRVGLKRYFGDTWFAALTLKSHGAAAEGVEFGVGVRL